MRAAGAAYRPRCLPLILAGCGQRDRFLSSTLRPSAPEKAACYAGAAFAPLSTMLALKLHKGKHPNTRRGSFWIPIVDWRSARIHLKNWTSTLAPVHYLTMISVPNRHPVFVGVDWSVRIVLPRQLPFVPLRDVEQTLLAALKPLTSRVVDGLIWVGQTHFTFGPKEIGSVLATYPEMVLGADLPRHCIKWTKNLRLLTRGNKRETLRKKATRQKEQA
jgi:hypothetical protein